MHVDTECKAQPGLWMCPTTPIVSVFLIDRIVLIELQCRLVTPVTDSLAAIWSDGSHVELIVGY